MLLLSSSCLYFVSIPCCAIKIESQTIFVVSEQQSMCLRLTSKIISRTSDWNNRFFTHVSHIPVPACGKDKNVCPMMAERRSVTSL